MFITLYLLGSLGAVVFVYSSSVVSRNHEEDLNRNL